MKQLIKHFGGQCEIVCEISRFCQILQKKWNICEDILSIEGFYRYIPYKIYQKDLYDGEILYEPWMEKNLKKNKKSDSLRPQPNIIYTEVKSHLKWLVLSMFRFLDFMNLVHCWFLERRKRKRERRKILVKSNFLAIIFLAAAHSLFLFFYCFVSL